jgi:prepilin-type N-terminal cleavage/methylation domain-containing protein
MKRSANGFTLIEIAIVLVIIGLLLGGVLRTGVDHGCAGAQSISAGRHQGRVLRLSGPPGRCLGDIPRPAPASTALLSKRRQRANRGLARHLKRFWRGITDRRNFLNGVTSGYQHHGNSDDTNNQESVQRLHQIIYDNAYGTDVAREIDQTQPENGQPGTGGVVAEVDRKVDDGLPDAGGFSSQPTSPLALTGRHDLHYHGHAVP